MSQQQPSIPRAPIFVGDAAEARVQQLGLPGLGVLVSALHDGASGARATTPFHPRSYRGQRMWGETVAALRFGLDEFGWDGENLQGADLVVDRQRGNALVVTAGDAATGHELYAPQVRYERREVIQRLVNGDFDTLWDADPRPVWDVWFLLHHLGADCLRAELSRPIGVAANGWVTGWAERILIPDAPFGGPTPGRQRDDQSPPAVDVDVQRRAG